MIVRSAERYGLSASEVFAVVEVESGFRPSVVSNAGAVGLMQIMPSTGKWIAEELSIEFTDDCLSDPKTNVVMGCFYLRYLYTRFGDPAFVYAAYNAGETVVSEWLAQGVSVDSIPYPETRAYVRKVEKRKKYFERKKFSANH